MYLAEIITGVLLPWVLLAPTIPLLLLLIRQRSADNTTMAMVLLCVALILSNVFTLVAWGSDIQRSFVHVSFLSEIIFTGLLLKFCSENNLLRYGIIASILIFGSVYISFLALTPKGTIQQISTVGTLFVFLVSILVLISKAMHVDQNIILGPEFWFAGGIFFRFGLLSILQLSGNSINDINYKSPNDIAVLYVVIYLIQFLFFATGVLIRKPWIGND